MENIYPVEIKYKDCIQKARVNIKTDKIIFEDPRIVKYELNRYRKVKIIK